MVVGELGEFKGNKEDTHQGCAVVYIALGKRVGDISTALAVNSDPLHIKLHLTRSRIYQTAIWERGQRSVTGGRTDHAYNCVQIADNSLRSYMYGRY